MNQRKSFAVFVLLSLLALQLIQVNAYIIDLNLVNDAGKVTEDFTVGDQVNIKANCEPKTTINVRIFKKESSTEVSQPTSINCNDLQYSLFTPSEAGTYRLEAQQVNCFGLKCFKRVYFSASRAAVEANVIELPFIAVLLILAVILFYLRRKKIMKANIEKRKNRKEKGSKKE